MNEEKLKIGTYTEDEIFNYMTEQEGGMLGRSMYDAIFDKIHAQITEIEQLKNENQQLKEKLEASEKSRKESMLILGEYRHYTLPTEEQNRENEDIVDKAYNNLILKQDIDKGE